MTVKKKRNDYIPCFNKTGIKEHIWIIKRGDYVCNFDPKKRLRLKNLNLINSIQQNQGLVQEWKLFSVG